MYEKKNFTYTLDKVEYERELLRKVVHTFQYTHLKYLLKDGEQID